MPASRVLCTFVPNKSFGQLLNVLLTNHISSKIFDLKFSYIEVWFTYQDFFATGYKIKNNFDPSY